MIHYVKDNLKDIERLGRDYPWEKPEVCPDCNKHHLWGHGYRDTLFEGFDRPLPMKRCRCPLCRCILIFRPEGYFPRIQTKITKIRASLSKRIQSGFWPKGISERGRYWLKCLKRQALGILGDHWRDRLLEAFDQLISMGKVPVARLL